MGAPVPHNYKREILQNMDFNGHQGQHQGQSLHQNKGFDHHQKIDHSKSATESFGLQNLIFGMPARSSGPAYSYTLQNMVLTPEARMRGGPVYSSYYLQNMALTPEARMRGGPVYSSYYLM